MATVEEGLTYEAVLEQDGLQVSKSPWGPDDEIGRLNWITAESNRAILEHLDGSHVFDLNVEFFVGMPSWGGGGAPPDGGGVYPKPPGGVDDNQNRGGGAGGEADKDRGGGIHK